MSNPSNFLTNSTAAQTAPAAAESPPAIAPPTWPTAGIGVRAPATVAVSDTVVFAMRSIWSMGDDVRSILREASVMISFSRADSIVLNSSMRISPPGRILASSISDLAISTASKMKVHSFLRSNLDHSQPPSTTKVFSNTRTQSFLGRLATARSVTRRRSFPCLRLFLLRRFSLKRRSFSTSVPSFSADSETVEEP